VDSDFHNILIAISMGETSYLLMFSFDTHSCTISLNILTVGSKLRLEKRSEQKAVLSMSSSREENNMYVSFNADMSSKE